MSTQPNNRPLCGPPHLSEIGVPGTRACPDDGAGVTPGLKSRVGGALFGPLDTAAVETLTVAHRTTPATAFDRLNTAVDLPLVTCPQCGEVASIEWHTTIDQMLHLKIRCISRHWFLLPAEMVDTYPSS